MTPKAKYFPTNEAFAENIDISLTKLALAAEKVLEKIVLLKQIRHKEEDTYSSPNELIREVLHERIDQCCAKLLNITAVTAQYETDETGHPSDIGTAQILNTLNDQVSVPKPLIWNPAFIVTEKAYSRVEAIYRYGCNICFQYGRALTRDRHNNQLVCDACIPYYTKLKHYSK